MNDQNDFAPEVRNSAWWSGDSRMAASGKAVEAILTKQGKLAPPDLSDVEAVQMGHIMQPVIGRLFQTKHQMELKDADYALTHVKEPWLRSHFDFISSDGKTLIEAKNYNAAYRNKFDQEQNRVPAADYAQCLHEATVHNVSEVYLAVLFGGQEFQTFHFTFSDKEKEDFIKTSATFWGYVQSNTTPEPQTVEQAKLVYETSNSDVITANSQLEQVIAALKVRRAQQKAFEDQTEELEVYIRNAMGNSAEIRSVDGSTLVSWKSSKASARFDAKLFQSSMPDLYNKFVIEQMGSRRFLIK
jgi:predicted phage-related endonuclease